MLKITIINNILKELGRFPISNDIITCKNKNLITMYNIESMQLTKIEIQKSRSIHGGELRVSSRREIVKLKLENGVIDIIESVSKEELKEVLKFIKNA